MTDSFAMVSYDLGANLIPVFREEVIQVLSAERHVHFGSCPCEDNKRTKRIECDSAKSRDITISPMRTLYLGARNTRPSYSIIRMFWCLLPVHVVTATHVRIVVRNIVQSPHVKANHTVTTCA